MSIKSLLSASLAFFLSLVLGGCITTDVEITLHPDGSGTLVYAIDFDRASEAMRDQIRQQFGSARAGRGVSRESLQELYPAPHFQLVSFEDDLEHLRTRVLLRFNDINALLISRKTADLGLKSLNFSVDENALVFSVHEENAGQPWPEKYDDVPGLERISIVNAQSGEKITFSRELTSATGPADWTGRLAFPGHTVVRDPNIQVFHDYPVAQMQACTLQSAQWNLRHVKSWSSLGLTLNATLPNDGSFYVRWEDPVVLSGGYRPGEHDALGLAGQGEFKQDEPSPIEFKLPLPPEPAATVEPLNVRLKAYRSSGSSFVNLGPLHPNTEYTVGELIITTDDLTNHRLGLKATGAADRLKSTWLETRRGNRFALKKASWSGTTEKRITYWESLPLEGCALCVEVYNAVEPCYVDMVVPALDLARRAWRVDEEAAESSRIWKPMLKAEHPELFRIDVPPVEQDLFEDKERYQAYFKALRDEQLMPALVEIVDFMIRHNPENGPDWIQDTAQRELRDRGDFLAAHRPEITEQLFSIYLHAPEEMSCLSPFFSNLQLQAFAQPRAIKALEEGNLRFAGSYFYGREFTAAEADVLKSALPKAASWVEQKGLLEILNRANCADLAFVLPLLKDRSLSEFVRSEALSIALEAEAAGDRLAGQIATDPSQEASLRCQALSFLLTRESFPAAALASCLASPECQKRAVQAVTNFLTHSVREAAVERKAAVLKALRPHVSMFEDLSEHLKKYEAEDAIKALEAIRRLEDDMAL